MPLLVKKKVKKKIKKKRSRKVSESRNLSLSLPSRLLQGCLEPIVDDYYYLLVWHASSRAHTHRPMPFVVVVVGNARVGD